MSLLKSTTQNLTRSIRFTRSINTTTIRFNTTTTSKPSESQPSTTKSNADSGLIASHSHTSPGEIVAPESQQALAADITSGAPSELRYRPVKIYRPTKSTMQSAKGKTKRWILDWDVLQGAGRWENPLMGWASSADYIQATSLAFRSKEDAVAFAERQGWDYYIETPKEIKIPPKNYASNYIHVPGKLRIHHTK